jgi:SAM-dependent methyltransferase
MPLSLGQNGDILTTVDHRDEETARRWAIESAVGKPWRPAFRAAFARILGERGPAPQRILELGSGPGLLARRVLRHVAVSEYVLLDFSEPMMRMARETLGQRDDISYWLCDFKEHNWHHALGGPFDAVISMQAVHELRHKRHVPRLYAEVATLLGAGGLLLVCDHEPAPDANELAQQLASTADEQERAMESAGFVSVNRHLFEHRCYLISALKPGAQNG